MRLKLPFGIAQIGKAFRNEITPGNFIFRTREFEQMEIEFFVNPLETIDGRPADEVWNERWIESRLAWYQRYGMRRENLRIREHEKDELAHYAKRTVDIEYQFPIGWSELEGVANRTDFDLKQHAQFSGKSLTYFDEERKQHVVPYVIEPSAGADRSLLAFLADAYREEEVRGERRVVLRFHPDLAPVKIAVLPLLKKRPEIVTTAHDLRATLARRWAELSTGPGLRRQGGWPAVGQEETLRLAGRSRGRWCWWRRRVRRCGLAARSATNRGLGATDERHRHDAHAFVGRIHVDRNQDHLVRNRELLFGAVAEDLGHVG